MKKPCAVAHDMVPVLAVVRRHKAAEAVIGEIVAAGSGAGTGPPLHRGDITAEPPAVGSQPDL